MHFTLGWSKLKQHSGGYNEENSELRRGMEMHTMQAQATLARWSWVLIRKSSSLNESHLWEVFQPFHEGGWFEDGYGEASEQSSDVPPVVGSLRCGGRRLEAVIERGRT
jgi:hypothetical protein